MTLDIQPRQIARLGWRRQLPDHRDQRYLFQVPRVAAMSRHVDMHDFAPVWDQGNAGSCTGHGAGAAWLFDRVKAKQQPAIMPSRLMAYFNARCFEGDWQSDAGATIRDVCKGLAKFGLCDESLWPYDLAKLTVQPTDAAYAAALPHRASSWNPLSSQDITTLKSVLAGGYGIVFGFTVYQSFMSDQVAKTGLVPMPGYNERSVGGHCVFAVGFNSRDYICCRNSWGHGWGDPDLPGHFWLPPAYISNVNLAADFAVVNTITA
jgi:C1A family cysteine protease